MVSKNKLSRLVTTKKVICPKRNQNLFAGLTDA